MLYQIELSPHVLGRIGFEPIILSPLFANKFAVCTLMAVLQGIEPWYSDRQSDVITTIR